MAFKLSPQGRWTYTGWARRETLQIKEIVLAKAWVVVLSSSSHGWGIEVCFWSIPPCSLLKISSLCVHSITAFLTSLSETPNHLSLIKRLKKIMALLTYNLYTCISFLWLQ